MEDRIAREGTLTHCNENPKEALDDIECANARRASVAIALRRERERVVELERQSQIKLDALRREIALQEQLVREARLAAERAEKEAYEALWRDQGLSGSADFEPVGPSEDRRSSSR